VTTKTVESTAQPRGAPSATVGTSTSACVFLVQSQFPQFHPRRRSPCNAHTSNGQTFTIMVTKNRARAISINALRCKIVKLRRTHWNDRGHRTSIREQRARFRRVPITMVTAMVSPSARPGPNDAPTIPMRALARHHANHLPARGAQGRTPRAAIAAPRSLPLRERGDDGQNHDAQYHACRNNPSPVGLSDAKNRSIPTANQRRIQMLTEQRPR